MPTGLAVAGKKVFVAEAGPVPYLPEDGKVVEFTSHGRAAHVVASGYSVMVDVEVGRHQALYAISQGDSPGGNVQPADPAKPDTGRLLRFNRDGSLTRSCARPAEPPDVAALHR